MDEELQEAIAAIVADYESTFGAQMPTAEPIRAVKVATFVPVSREVLNPSAVDPADVARWTTEREARESREDARQATLLTAGGVVAAIATLHSPDKNRDCQGCDGSDYGPSPWPCPTWDVLDEQADAP